MFKVWGCGTGFIGLIELGLLGFRVCQLVLLEILGEEVFAKATTSFSAQEPSAQDLKVFNPASKQAAHVLGRMVLAFVGICRAWRNPKPYPSLSASLFLGSES